MDLNLERQTRDAFEQGERNWGFLPRNRLEGWPIPNQTLSFFTRGFHRLGESINSPHNESVIDAACFGVAVGAITAAVLLQSKILR